jgi:hypothetical protein
LEGLGVHWRISERIGRSRRRPPRGDTPAWGLGDRLTTSHLKKWWKDNIRMDLKEVGWEGVHLMRLAQWWVLMNNEP